MRKLGTVAAILALALVAGACGGDDGEPAAVENGADDAPQNLAELIEREPHSIVQRHLEAAATGDGEEACELLAPEARERIAREDLSCESHFETAAARDPEPALIVQGERVEADDLGGLDYSATIVVRREPIARVWIDDGEEPAELRLIDTHWRIFELPDYEYPPG